MNTPDYYVFRAPHILDIVQYVNTRNDEGYSVHTIEHLLAPMQGDVDFIAVITERFLEKPPLPPPPTEDSP